MDENKEKKVTFRKKRIIIAAVCLVIGFAAGFGGYFIGRNASAKNASDASAEISEPTVTYSDFQNNEALVDEYTADDFGADYLVKNYGMPQSTASDYVKHPEEWLAYNLYVTVKNNDVDQLSCFGFTSDDSGKDGVYFFTGDAGVTSIPAKGTYNICVPVLIKNSDLSDADAQKLVKSMRLSLCYGAYFEQSECVNYYTEVKF